MSTLPYLLDRARRGTWSGLAASPTYNMHECDFTYVSGTYYAFGTDTLALYTTLREGNTLTAMVNATPTYIVPTTTINISSSMSSGGTTTFSVASIHGLSTNNLVKIHAHPAFDNNDVLLSVTGTTSTFIYLVNLGNPTPATGGTFTLTVNGQTTSAIAYNATPATVQAALVALSSVGAGNVVVSSPNSVSGPYTINFKSTVTMPLSKNFAGLTGGSGNPTSALLSNTFIFKVAGNSTGGGLVGTISSPVKIRYPSVVFDVGGATWHLWGTSSSTGASLHYTASDPAGLWTLESGAAFGGVTLVDISVRKHPTNGYWYAVGLVNGTNQPVQLLRASSPNGPWAPLTNTVNTGPAAPGGIFNNSGNPPWAIASQADPDIIITPDNRMFVTMTARHDFGPPDLPRATIVEINPSNGQAYGAAVVLFDTGVATVPGTDITFVSDMSLVSATGQPDVLLGYNNTAGGYPVSVLSMNEALPTDKRTSEDLTRIDMGRGYDVATGTTPKLPGTGTPPAWGAGGLAVSDVNGGAYGYLSSSIVRDFTVSVEFTPSSIAGGATNTVSHMGTADYGSGAFIDVMIANTGTIQALIIGTDGTAILLDSGLTAQVGTRYAVVVRRLGMDASLTGNVTLSVNGVVVASDTNAAIMTSMESWSLAAQTTFSQAAQNAFVGTVHSYSATNSGQLSGWYGQGAQV